MTDSDSAAFTADTDYARHRAFRAVLSSTVSFFLLAIAAIIFGFVRGGDFVAPSFARSSAFELVVFALGLGFPAITAACVIVAWVRYSVGDTRSCTRLARLPWIYFTVFVGALIVLKKRR
ncbi:MAG: hypothetical protein H7Z43_10440 [Clostridia bacterium]|nr:hypothetical protein [Deltaproteobacteria bacterium]